MKLLENKKIKIGDKDYPVKLTVRAMIKYQQLAGKSIEEIDTLEDVTLVFYCSILAGGTDITYDQFMDLIDEDFDSIRDFKNALLESTEKKKKTAG